MNITEEPTSATPSSRGETDGPGHLAAREDLRALRKREWTVLGLLLALVIVAYFNVKRIVVSGVSMQPTFKSAQSVFVWTSVPHSSLKRGDIIVFNSPDGDEYIKRIVFIQSARGDAPWPKYLETGRGEVPADAWFDTSVEVDIVEHSIASPQHGTVLSLLWIPERSAARLF